MVRFGGPRDEGKAAIQRIKTLKMVEWHEAITWLSYFTPAALILYQYLIFENGFGLSFRYLFHD